LLGDEVLWFEPLEGGGYRLPWYSGPGTIVTQ